MLVGKLSPRSTQCTPLHRFRISIFRSKFCEFFVKFWHFLLFFSMILLDFFEILLKFRWNFWKFHGNPLNLQISMNFRGCRDKTQTQMREETQRRPVCPPPTWRWGFGGRKRTLPWRGGREKKCKVKKLKIRMMYSWISNYHVGPEKRWECWKLSL